MKSFWASVMAVIYIAIGLSIAGNSEAAEPISIIDAPVITTGLPDGAAGVYTWGSWNPQRVTRETHPLIKGVPMTLHWNRLEPRSGEFEFDKLVGEPLREAVRNDFFVHMMIWFAPDSPRWLYENGVPEVKVPERINPQRKLVKKTFPYYLDAEYVRYYDRVIRALGEYVFSLDEALRDRIIFVQCAEGSTGDGQPYKGVPLEDKYAISFERWGEFRVRAWGVYKEAFQPQGAKPIALLVNNDANRGPEHDWLLKNLPSVGAKQGMFSHGYHISDTQKRLADWRDYVQGADKAGLSVFTRGEQDAEWKVCGWSSRNPPQGFYWSALFALHCGLDVWNIPYEASEGLYLKAAITFFNKYAGQHDPSKSPGAFCALRQGLDAADIEIFPVDQFGKASKINTERFINIANAFAEQGAYQGDPEKAIRGGMINRQRDDYNDVGWGILPGNYQKFLTQIEPDTTSQGYWHVGPTDNVFSRFGRGFKLENKKPAMYFKLNSNFFASPTTTATPHTVNVRIVYLDRGHGQWSLDYNQRDQTKSAITVTCQDTGLWKEINHTLNDAIFNGGLSKGADLILRSLKPGATVFHLVEIERK